MAEQVVFRYFKRVMRTFRKKVSSLGICQRHMVRFGEPTRKTNGINFPGGICRGKVEHRSLSLLGFFPEIPILKQDPTPVTLSVENTISLGPQFEWLDKKDKNKNKPLTASCLDVGKKKVSKIKKRINLKGKK